MASLSDIVKQRNMKASAEALYRQLGAVVAEMPVLGLADPTPDEERWLARAFALVEASGDIADTVAFKKEWENLRSDHWRESSATRIRDFVGRALARAELGAPAAAQGAFVTAGSSFDAYQVIRKVLVTATQDVLIVDPYLNEVVMTDFAPLVPASVTIRLLADSANQAASQSLKIAVQRWVAQYGGQRVATARATPARQLHDRLIVVDSAEVWLLSQSLKDFAARAPATIVRADSDIATLKIQFYGSTWGSAASL